MRMSIKSKPKTRQEEVPKAREMGQEQSTGGIFLESVSRMFCPKCEQKINTSSIKALSEGRCPSCGEKIIVEGKVGPYRIIKLIGRGGMGAVYEGFDDGLKRKVAIKVTLVDVTRNRTMLETFQREAQVVAKLNHPNVVRVYAFGEEKGHPYLVMELLPSGSLHDRISRDEPIDIAFLMGVALEVLEGLDAAQKAGLLHGDIKPENILFDDKIRAKLVDFGLAAMNGATNSGEVWGTPFYIAPEKVTERKSGIKSDIYSLGASLYHALARRPPFDGTDGTTVIKLAIAEMAKPLSSIRPDVPPEVEVIISRMMEKDISRRYPNCKSIVSDIKRFLATVPREHLPGTSRMLSSTVKTQKPFLKILAVAAILVVGVVILGAGYGVMKQGSTKTQEQLFAKSQQVDAQYSKVLHFIQSTYTKIAKADDEAQRRIRALQEKSEKISKGGKALVVKIVDLETLGQKIHDIRADAELTCKHAEHVAPAPLAMGSVERVQLASRWEILSEQLTKGKEIKVKAEEAESFLSGMIKIEDALEFELKRIK